MINIRLADNYASVYKGYVRKERWYERYYK